MQNNSEKINTADKINDFVQRNRKGIFVAICAVIILFAGFVVFISVKAHVDKKATAEVEELNRKFDELRFYIGEEYYAGDVDALLGEVETFTGKKVFAVGDIFIPGKNFASSKAWSIAARIYSGREEWQKAQDAWLNAANAGARTYLGPIALFNAAVCAEEQGKLEQAIDLFQQCVSSKFEFPAAPRAQFSIGRLYEQLGDFSAALEAYRDVLINWQDMPVWQHLARSRITSIEVR
jgi:tetratricopeptide (TPR) repeat protein